MRSSQKTQSVGGGMKSQLHQVHWILLQVVPFLNVGSFIAFSIFHRKHRFFYFFMGSSNQKKIAESSGFRL